MDWGTHILTLQHNEKFKKNMTEKMKAVFSLDVKKKERKEKKRGTSDRDEKENFQ